MATIRTHTTLRTLFAATTVFAFLAASLPTAPWDDLHRVILRPCAVGFLSGLFGLSFVAAFLIALATAWGIDALFLGSIRGGEFTPEWAIRLALADLPRIALWSLAPSLTTWWWGRYLRRQWSKPAQSSEPTVQEVNDSRKGDELLTLRERLRASVEITPIGIFVLTVLGNMIVFIILDWLEL